MKTNVVTIAVQTTERAQIIKAKLDSEGIECMLNTMEAQFDPLFVGVKIMVKENDVKKALEIVSALQFEYGDDSPVIEKKRDKIITISVSSWQKAELMHELLASMGIQSALLNVNLLQSDISGGVKLRVFESDVEKAMEIIRSTEDTEAKPRRSPAYAMGEVLVPVDFTETSTNASKIAAELAARADVPLRLFHAYFDTVITAIPIEEASYTFHASAIDLFKDTEEGLKTSIELLNKKLGKIIDKLGKKVKVKNTIVKGIASDAILDYSAFHQPGLIVMSRGLHEDRTGLFMGNVSGKVAERADVPVMIIPNEYSFKGLDQLNNIAYATDFDDSDQKALDRLWAITRFFGGNFHCLHVSVPGESALDKARIQRVRKEFEQMSGREVKCSVIESPDVLAGFNRFIKENQIDMLAVTTHKRNLLTRLFYPSLTRRMMLHTELPLLVFHA